MVSDALEKALEKRGFSAISIEQGVQAFIHELFHGPGGQAVILAHKLPNLAPEKSLHTSIESEKAAD